jgi:hypothetical protein
MSWDAHAANEALRLAALDDERHAAEQLAAAWAVMAHPSGGHDILQALGLIDYEGRNLDSRSRPGKRVTRPGTLSTTCFRCGRKRSTRHDREPGATGMCKDCASIGWR